MLNMGNRAPGQDMTLLETSLAVSGEPVLVPLFLGVDDKISPEIYLSAVFILIVGF